MRAVIFDLDQTLYPEAEYVRSGFHAVAEAVSRRAGVMAAAVEEELMAILRRDGRGRVFDTLLAAHGWQGKMLPETLLHIYRTHTPSLQLHADAAELLRRLPVPLGLLTDGHPTVQAGKVAALGIAARFSAIVCTADLGLRTSKPAAVGFRVCLERLGVAARDAAYVGDDLAKDFAAPRALGMRTVRVARPVEAGFTWTSAGQPTEADLVVDDLTLAAMYLCHE